MEVICVINEQFSAKQTSLIQDGERICEALRLDMSIRNFDSLEHRHDREITSLPAFHVYNKKRIVDTFYDAASIDSYVMQKRNKPMSLLKKLFKTVRSPFSRA